MNKFLLAAQKYEHLKFYNNIITLKMLLWGIYGGFLIGIAAAYYNKVFIGNFIRQLLKKEALNPESAVPLSDMKIKGKALIKLALKRDGALKKYAEIANRNEITTYKNISPKIKKLRRFFGKEEQPVKLDFDKAKFYIPENLKYRADTIYDKKGSNPYTFLIFAIILTALVFAINFIIPELLTMLDNFIGIASKPE